MNLSPGILCIAQHKSFCSKNFITFSKSAMAHTHTFTFFLGINHKHSNPGHLPGQDFKCFRLYPKYNGLAFFSFQSAVEFVFVKVIFSLFVILLDRLLKVHFDCISSNVIVSLAARSNTLFIQSSTRAKIKYLHVIIDLKNAAKVQPSQKIEFSEKTLFSQHGIQVRQFAEF